MIKLYTNALTKKFCKDLIKKFEKDREKEPQVLPGGKMAITLNLSASKYFKHEDEVILKAVGKMLDKYRKEVIPITFYGECKSSVYVMQRLDKDDGDSALHIDAPTFNSCNRYLTMVFALNFGKCSTEFPEQNVTEHMIEGSVLIHPPFWTHPHTVSAPKKNQYIVTTFIQHQ